MSQLIEQRHFGLVGVHERAEIIRADLLIETAPGQGTCVHLHWERRTNA